MHLHKVAWNSSAFLFKHFLVAAIITGDGTTTNDYIHPNASNKLRSLRPAVSKRPDTEINYSQPLDSPDQPTKSSNIYHLADNSEDPTYLDLSEEPQSKPPPSKKTQLNTDEGNYYNILVNDEQSGVKSSSRPIRGKYLSLSQQNQLLVVNI